MNVWSEGQGITVYASGILTTSACYRLRRSWSFPPVGCLRQAGFDLSRPSSTFVGSSVVVPS